MRPANIEDLPDPIIEYILSHLSPYRDLKQCMQVNKTWYRYVYDVIRKTQRDFNNAICGMAVHWQHMNAEPGPTVSKRYSHSACCIGNSMYVFGGCTTANTTFNDLWRLDLGTRCWIRPLAIGTYPPPKACATLVSHGDKLVLFGGWTHTSPYPLHQVWRIFNHLHVYNTITNRWTQIQTGHCPAMAGHSATIHGDMMVVFGGIQRQISEGSYTSSNEVWVFDLKNNSWRKQPTSSIQPPPRYGHSQIFIDKNHLLIMGGCGGPNKLFTDIWLLKMSDMADVSWEWEEMEVRMKENAAPLLAFHPACKVGSQVVVMSKAQRFRTSPSSLPQLLRAPSRLWVPPCGNTSADGSFQVRVVELEPHVNGKRGVLKRRQASEEDAAKKKGARRQRQLEGLARMAQRIQDLRADIPRLPYTTKNPMCLYVLDISQTLTAKQVTWRASRAASAPEEIILYSLVLGKGELIMFGGIQKDLNSRQQEGETIPEIVSNALHFMSAQRFII